MWRECVRVWVCVLAKVRVYVHVCESVTARRVHRVQQSPDIEQLHIYVVSASLRKRSIGFVSMCKTKRRSVCMCVAFRAIYQVFFFILIHRAWEFMGYEHGDVFKYVWFASQACNRNIYVYFRRQLRAAAKEETACLDISECLCVCVCRTGFKLNKTASAWRTFVSTHTHSHSRTRNRLIIAQHNHIRPLSPSSSSSSSRRQCWIKKPATS